MEMEFALLREEVIDRLADLVNIAKRRNIASHVVYRERLNNLISDFSLSLTDEFIADLMADQQMIFLMNHLQTYTREINYLVLNQNETYV
jgi:hypothetical protein